MSFLRALKQTPFSSKSATFVIENEDLLIQILLFLPTKSLIKFQTVNNQWRSIISSDYFSRLHTEYSRHRPKPLPSFILSNGRQQFFYFNPVAKTFIPVRFNYPYTYSYVLQSCNGLLLLECRMKQYGRKEYYVHNPITNQFRKIPLNNKFNESKATVPCLCLVFDPSKSLDFKVICIWKMASPNQLRVEVYSQSSRSWETLGEPFPFSRFTNFSNGIYWNDGIYWIRPSSNSYVLDLDSGTFGTPPTIKPPPRKTGQSNKNYIVESNGHMHCVSYYSRQDEHSMSIFEMERDGSGWFQKYSLDLNPVADLFNEMVHTDMVVLGIIRGETEDESAVLIHIPGKIICYWFRKWILELAVDLTKLGYEGDRFMFGSRGYVHQFTESLTPI